jgi:hypothetical protein
MDSMSGWDLLKLHFQQPEYLHVLLNPLPIYGLVAGLLAMAVALGVRHRRADLVALAVVFVSALSAWPVAEFGERAYDHVVTMPDRNGVAWLDNHRARAESVLWVFFAVAALAAAAAFVPLRWPRTARPLFIATLLGTLAALGCGGWIGYAGGQIRHKEFRYGEPPKETMNFEN